MENLNYYQIEKRLEELRCGASTPSTSVEFQKITDLVKCRTISSQHLIGFHCSYCGSSFHMFGTNYRHRTRAQLKIRFFCSFKCAARSIKMAMTESEKEITKIAQKMNPQNRLLYLTNYHLNNNNFFQ